MSGDFAGIGVFDFDFHATQGRMKMGFGLSTDLKVVQDHGGEIRIESKGSSCLSGCMEVTITCNPGGCPDTEAEVGKAAIVLRRADTGECTPCVRYRSPLLHGRPQQHQGTMRSGPLKMGCAERRFLPSMQAVGKQDPDVLDEMRLKFR